MVIIVGTIEVDPDQRDMFVASQAAEMAACRAEPGCIDWSMLLDPDRPDVVRLLEVWADVPAFETHLEVLAVRQPAANVDPAVAAAVRGVELTRHDVAASSALA
jgi:quinol monooxygenase YgiN